MTAFSGHKNLLITQEKIGQELHPVF